MNLTDFVIASRSNNVGGRGADPSATGGKRGLEAEPPTLR